MTTTGFDVTPRPGGARMRASAHLVTECRRAANDAVHSCVSTLHSDAPMMLRMARPKAPEPWVWTLGDTGGPGGSGEVLRVAVAAGAAGPVGGDQLDLTVEVGAGSSLVLSEISPTLLLPGPHGERSCTRVRIHVAVGATLIWLPEPMIAAHGCDHVHDVAVHLADGARLFMREEILLGRHGEPSGQVGQRISVRLAGRPLYCQELQAGTRDAATPALLGDHRAVGSIVIVDPAWVEDPPPGRRLTGEAAVLPLAGPAAVISALAGDNLQLRSQLNAGLTTLGAPWTPAPEHPRTSTPTTASTKEPSHD